MTHVSTSSFAAPLASRSIRKFYQIEVVTFDGDTEVVEVLARTEEEAQNEAAYMVANADYTTVLACWVA